MASMTPTMHRPVPMNSRVSIPELYLGKPATGTVVGISAQHVIFWYIVLLDQPHQVENGEEHRAIVIGGPELKSEDGTSDWTLPPEMWGKYELGWYGPVNGVQPGFGYPEP